jgi:hypothetical protein
MTHYPQRPGYRTTETSANSLKQAPLRDVLWGRPLFKAPHLQNPRVAFDPLPFTALRVTHRAAQ